MKYVRNGKKKKSQFSSTQAMTVTGRFDKQYFTLGSKQERLTWEKQLVIAE